MNYDYELRRTKAILEQFNPWLPQEEDESGGEVQVVAISVLMPQHAASRAGCIHQLLLAVTAPMMHQFVCSNACQQTSSTSNGNLHSVATASLISVGTWISIRRGHGHLPTIVLICIVLICITVLSHVGPGRITIATETSATAIAAICSSSWGGKNGSSPSWIIDWGAPSRVQHGAPTWRCQNTTSRRRHSAAPWVCVCSSARRWWERAPAAWEPSWIWGWDWR